MISIKVCKLPILSSGLFSYVKLDIGCYNVVSSKQLSCKYLLHIQIWHWCFLSHFEDVSRWHIDLYFSNIFNYHVLFILYSIFINVYNLHIWFQTWMRCSIIASTLLKIEILKRDRSTGLNNQVILSLNPTSIYIT